MKMWIIDLHLILEPRRYWNKANNKIIENMQMRMKTTKRLYIHDFKLIAKSDEEITNQLTTLKEFNDDMRMDLDSINAQKPLSSKNDYKEKKILG